MPFKAHIRKDNGEEPDSFAGISLPTTANVLYAALQAIDFKPEDIDRFKIESIVPIRINAIIANYIPETIHLTSIDTLNYLATELDKMGGDDLRQQKLHTLIQWAEHSEEVYPGEFVYPFDGDLGDLINIVLNMDRFTFSPSTSDFTDLGLHAVYSEITEGKRNSEDIEEDFDYEDHGESIAKEENGVILNGCYIAGGDGFVPFMEMDNAIPESCRVWREAVVNYLPEDQKDKGFEYFRPKISYSALAERSTGISVFDLAAQIVDFCHVAKINGFGYDDGCTAAIAVSTIEVAAMLEDRATQITDMLDKAAEYLLIVPDEAQDNDYTTYKQLKAAFNNLDKELENLIQSEWERGYSGDGESLIEHMLLNYPEPLRKDDGFVTLLVNREIHQQKYNGLAEQHSNPYIIEEPPINRQLFQLLPSDLQVQIELEYDTFYQLTRTQCLHESKILVLYDKAIADYQQAFAEKDTRETPRDGRKPSMLGRLHDTVKALKEQPGTTGQPKKGKDNQEL